MLRGVIFDVDGTLVDSVGVHAQAWVDAFREFGHDIGFSAVRKQIGKGGDQLLPVFLEQSEIDTIGGELEGRRAEILKERYLVRIKGFPGVRELVRRLQGDGVRVALASSAKKDELQVYKKVAGIDDLIATETSSDDAEKSKPHPDIFEAALARLPGVAPDEILVVGDTPYDAEAASKAGLRTVGVLSGGFPEAELRAAGCVAIYRDPADVLAHYEQFKTGGYPMSDAQSTAPLTEQARQAGAAAAEHARNVAAEAQSRATSLAGEVKAQAASLGEAQKDKAADALESVAKAMHQSGASLEGNQEWAARLVERGAAELNSLATSLRQNDIQGLMDNLGSLARRQPAVFVGASMAAGFLLTRLGRLAAEGASNTQSVSDTQSASNGATPTSVPIYASEARNNGQY